MCCLKVFVSRVLVSRLLTYVLFEGFSVLVSVFLLNWF